MTRAAEQPRGPVDVCLLNMPYAAVQRPSIAVGMLKSALARDGFRVAALYPNLWLAARVGLKTYHLVDYTRSEDLIGEWTFAGIAFPEFEPDHDAYLREVSERLLVSSRVRARIGTAERLRTACYRLREGARAFIDEVAHAVLALSPRIVGCTSTFQQHVASLALLRRLRELDPSVVSVLGGANCETSMGLATHRNAPWVDFVVSGEADAFVGELVAGILEQGRALPAERCAWGVFAPIHRESGYPGAELPEAPRATTSRLVDMPVPDYDDFFRTLDETGLAPQIEPGLPIETSRGCWWGAKQHCTFCGLNGSGMTFRSRPPAEVLAELRSQSARHGRKNFEAVDNILDMGYFKTVLKELAQSEERYRLFYEIKSNMSRQRAEEMKAAGLVWAQPGIESLHSGILALIRKGVDAWQNVQLLKWCREVGIRLSWNFLFGFPGEKDEWYAEMASWMPAIVHFQPPTGLLQVRIDRYSPYYSQREAYGLNLRPGRCYGYVYPFAPPDLMAQAYFFEYEGEVDYLRGGAGDGYGRRPGLAALWQVVASWAHQRWWRVPPMLCADDCGDAIRLFDTRPCASEQVSWLRGLERDIFQLCDDGQGEHQLAGSLAALHGGPVDPAAVERAVADLVARRLLLHLDGHYLSLALRGAIPTLPEDFPGGFVIRAPADGRPETAGQVTQ